MTNGKWEVRRIIRSPWARRKSRAAAPVRSPAHPCGDLRRSGGRRRRYRRADGACRSEEHTSELQSLMRISYAVFCLKKKKIKQTNTQTPSTNTTKHTSLHTDSHQTHILPLIDMMTQHQ